MTGQERVSITAPASDQRAWAAMKGDVDTRTGLLRDARIERFESAISTIDASLESSGTYEGDRAELQRNRAFFQEQLADRATAAAQRHNEMVIREMAVLTGEFPAASHAA